jgi:hypothetical protein
MRIGPISCRLPSRVEGRSVASRTSWPAGLPNPNAGTPFPTNANQAVPEHGSPQPATRPTGPNGTRQAEICRNSPGATPTDGFASRSLDRPYWQVKAYVSKQVEVLGRYSNHADQGNAFSTYCKLYAKPGNCPKLEPLDRFNIDWRRQRSTG